MPSILEDFKHFLKNSPTSWHAVEEIGLRLREKNFKRLMPNQKWPLEPGGHYYVQKGGSLCAFKVPHATCEKIIILGAHTDSPALILKPSAELNEGGLCLLGTEIYGSPLLSSWFNRDLAIAGRVISENALGTIEENLLFLKDHPLIIAQLALHLDRDIGDKHGVMDKQDHLRPIFGIDTQNRQRLNGLLSAHVGQNKILSFDLMLVPLEEPRYVGIEKELIASYRLDNLSSAHACLNALLASPASGALQMAIFFDHEEIGSRTAEGAASPFFNDTLKRLQHFFQMSEEDMLCVKENSFCVSVDVAHAYNPNFSNKYDPNHRPHIGCGIVIKHNADKKYATDAKSAAQVIKSCQRVNVNYQSFASRSNIPCGSTIGPILAQMCGIQTADIGVPIFSMHSAREIASCSDHQDMCTLLTDILKT